MQPIHGEDYTNGRECVGLDAGGLLHYLHTLQAFSMKWNAQGKRPRVLPNDVSHKYLGEAWSVMEKTSHIEEEMCLSFPSKRVE